MKTTVQAAEDRQELLIERVFDLPVEWLFEAYTIPAYFEEWMSHEYGKVKVEKMDMHPHGGWRFVTTDKAGHQYVFTGVIHDIIEAKSIKRTFEFEQSGFGVQLELLTFEKLSAQTSRLQIHSIYQSVAHRDALLKQGMVKGLDMALERLERFMERHHA